MIPLRDNIPNVHPPIAVCCIITCNTLVYLYQMGLSDLAELRFLHLWGVAPARYIHPEWASLAGYPPSGGLPLITSMFIHSGFLHFLLNMWVLWVFADNIEDVMGPLRFIAFYLTCGLAALGAHIFFSMDSPVPMVGASGAIAGVMGGYFLLYPHARVFTFIPILIIPYFIELPAVLFLGLWLLIQILSGLDTNASGGVAWWAHIGGFLAGVLLIPLFQNKRRCTYCYRPDNAHDV